MLMFMVDFDNVACVRMLSRVLGSVDVVLMVVVDGCVWVDVDLGGGTEGGLSGGFEIVAAMGFLVCDVGVCDVSDCEGV